MKTAVVQYGINPSVRSYNMKKNKLTRHQLTQITGVPFHRIDYLRMTGRLPIVQESLGKGRPTYFHPSAIEIIKSYYGDSYQDGGSDE